MSTWQRESDRTTSEPSSRLGIRATFRACSSFEAAHLAALVVIGCAEAEAPTTAAPSSISDPSTVLFDEFTVQSQTEFTYTYRKNSIDMSKDSGGGAAADDFDNDGDIDLFVCNGGGPNALFWNRGDGVFDEGAEAAGVAFPEEWTLAAGAADIDNDGDQDLYLVNYKVDRLLENQGDRTFVDITDRAQLMLPASGHGVQFGDVNGDRILDIFVGVAQPQLGSDLVLLDLKWARPHLLLGSAAGTYRDVGESVTPGGLAKGNVFVGALIDLDADGDVELYMIEDSQANPKNVLYENLGPGPDGEPRFKNVSATCGCEEPYAGMGVAAMDIDSNGLPDLYVSNHYSSYPNREVLLLNRGGLAFHDVTEQLGADPMRPFEEDVVRSVSWAAVPLDVENDSIEDVFLVYGGIMFKQPPEIRTPNDPQSVADQPDALLRGQWDGSYVVASGSGVEDMGRGHAAVTADFNGDGCQDLYVVNLGTPSRMYKNRCVGTGRWVEFLLEGTRSNRDAIAARVRIEAGGRVQWRQVLGCTEGVHSCLPKRIHFGLRDATRVDRVEIHWPAGGVQVLENLDVDRLHKIKEPDAASTRTPTGGPADSPK